MRGGRLPVRLFGMLCSLCMITPLLVLGSGAMRLCRPVVVIGGVCMAVGTHSISLFRRRPLQAPTKAAVARVAEAEGEEH